MSTSTSPRGETYRVLVNRMEQYSIWPVDRVPPAGWAYAGKTGSKDECLAHIEEVWAETSSPMAQAGL